ncbi:MAG: class I SAM-dependent methyltransferase [Acidobacteriota bacterium]
MDPFEAFKAVQREGWAYFAPLEMVTIPTAGQLVVFAGIRAGQRVADLACGTGVVAVTAARLGAKVTGLDLTPELLTRARLNASIAEVDIDFHEGDVEKLPFADAAFDVVVSQFGHMFAPRPDVALAEMLRVLKPGGTLAFSTWPPELFTGSMFTMVSRYLGPPAGPAPAPAPLWGDPNVVRERLGTAVRDIVFKRADMNVATMSPQHHRQLTERTAGPVRQLVASFAANDPAKLAAFRREYDDLASQYIEQNIMRQGYLMTRSTKI